MSTAEKADYPATKDENKLRTGMDTRKESSIMSLIDGKPGRSGSGTEADAMQSLVSSPKVNKKFINNWRHACDRTKDRTKELLKKWRTLPEPENEESSDDIQEEISGWSEHVWTTWVKRFPSGEDSNEVALVPLELTPVQKQKFGNFFTYLLDLDRDDAISIADFEALFERFRHFADWTKNSAEHHRLLEVQRGFIEYFLIPPDVLSTHRPYEVMEKSLRTQQLELDQWLSTWSQLLNGTRNFLQFPLWLQCMPRILFQVINTSCSGNISMTELGIFYSSVVGLTEREVNSCLKKVYKVLTSNGEHELNSSVFRLCFANFILGRFPNGPGEYLMYPLGHEQVSFPIDYKALSCAPKDLEQYSPIVATNRRSVIV